MASDWLTVKEAAAYLKISRTTLYRMVSDGKLKAYELPGSGRKRFKQSELDAAMGAAPEAETER